MNHLSRRVLLSLSSVLLIVAGLLGAYLASSLPAAHAESVVEGFLSDTTLERGQVVVVSKGDKTKVELASPSDLKNIYGVVIDPGDAPISLSREGQKVFVATSGHYQVLVSNENGSINSGDYVSASSIKGIAARATQSQEFVLGKALDSFDGRTGSITTTTAGNSLGRILVDISAGKNPLIDGGKIPSFLQRAGNVVAGKTVSPARIYASLGVLVITTFLVFSLLYTGVRGSIIAIGRNPLGRPFIIKGLVQTLLLGLIIFVIGIFGVYLLLKT